MFARGLSCLRVNGRVADPPLRIPTVQVTPAQKHNRRGDPFGIAAPVMLGLREKLLVVPSGRSARISVRIAAGIATGTAAV
jgi:hypothetical protein